MPVDIKYAHASFGWYREGNCFQSRRHKNMFHLYFNA